MENQPRVQLKKLSDGRIAITQETVGKYEISYNPDDELFYIYLEENVVARYNLLRNAVQYCRKH